MALEGRAQNVNLGVNLGKSGVGIGNNGDRLQQPSTQLATRQLQWLTHRLDPQHGAQHQRHGQQGQ